MEIHLEHEIALREIGIPEKEYSFEIKQNIKSLKAMIKNHIAGKTDEEIDPEAVVRIEAKSAEIADEMQTFSEANLPDEPINQNTMLTGKDLERAQAVGLNESNTLKEVEAKEQELKESQAAADALAARAAAVNLPADANEEQIAEAEKAAQDAAEAQAKADAEAAEKAEALKARAIAAGLADTATEEEIEAAEKQLAEDAKNTPPPAPSAPAPPKSAADDIYEFLS